MKVEPKLADLPLKNPSGLKSDLLLKNGLIGQDVKQGHELLSDTATKVDLSAKSLDLSKKLADTVGSIPKPILSSAPIPEEKKEPKLSKADLKKQKEIEEVKKNMEIKAFGAERPKIHVPTIKTPAIFFVGGLDPVGLSSQNKFLKTLAQNFPEGRYYDWSQKQDMIDQALKHTSNQKIILVGQGLGGDTAVEVAQELNSLKKGFRSVDLLVTMDSVGLNNDIIPANVSHNLNFISGDGSLLADGPHVAKDDRATMVDNILLEKGTSSIPEDDDLQRRIFSSIKEALNVPLDS